MSNIDMNGWAQSLIASPRRVAIPVMTHPGIELCGYTVRQAVSDGAIHAQAIRKLNEVYPAAATTIIMDLTVEAEAFGANVVFEDHSIPTVTGRLVTDMRTVATLPVPGLDKGRVQEYLKANKLSAESIRPLQSGRQYPKKYYRRFPLSNRFVPLRDHGYSSKDNYPSFRLRA